MSRHLVPLERADAANRAITRFVGGGQAEPSWRGRRGKADPLAERPWLRHYEQGVPGKHSVSLTVPSTTCSNSASRLHTGIVRAVVFGGRTLTYGQLNSEVNRLANALRSLGVEIGTRVMLLLPNTPQFIIAYFAILKAGGVVISTSPVNDREELQRQVADLQADILITLTVFSKTARHLLANSALRGVIFTNIKDYLAPPQKLLFTLRREKPGRPCTLRRNPEKRVPVDETVSGTPGYVTQNQGESRSVAVIKYTGGTTDKPKGVMLSHRALLANTLQTRHWITQLHEGREAVLAVVPFSHSYGMTTSMNVPIALGAKIIPLPGFITLEVLKTIKRHKPTLFPGVPTMYMAINQFSGVRKYGISSIKACISGAAPLPVEVQEAFEKLTRGRLVEGYGLTEAGPVTHANPLNGLRKVGSIGVPLPSTEAAVLDLITGEPVRMQIGELAVRGPQVMEGYWGEQQTTKRRSARTVGCIPATSLAWMRTVISRLSAARKRLTWWGSTRSTRETWKKCLMSIPV